MTDTTDRHDDEDVQLVPAAQAVALAPARPSSSTLGAWHRHCAAAALRQLRREDVDRKPFGQGVAAHACLEAMATDRRFPLDAARKAASSLMLGNRIYKGHAEPPYDPEACMAGLRIACAWAEEVGVPKGKPEVGIAVDRDWRLVDYDGPAYYYSQLLDMVRVFDDEDDDGELVRVLRIEDYKTAWSTGPAEIDSLQMRGAVCLGAALAVREDCQAVEVQVAALRKLRWVPEVPRRLYLDRPVDAGRIDEWRIEISMAVDAIMELAGREPDSVASPGGGCLACPYKLRCEPMHESAAALGTWGAMAEASDPRTAEALLAAEALADQARADLQQIADRNGAIALPDGRHELGYHAKERATLRDDAIVQLAGHLGWTPAEESLAINLGIGAGPVRNLIKSMRKNEGANHALLDALSAAVLTTERVAKWGVTRRRDTEIPALELAVDAFEAGP